MRTSSSRPTSGPVRLPTRFRDIGPHIELLPAGVPKLVGSSYVEAPGTDGPDVAWWCYEEHRASLKRTIAAAGFPARRGPAARRSLRRNEAGLLPSQRAPRGHGRERRAGPALLPELSALLRPTVPLGQGPGARRSCASRRTTTGWSRSGAARVRGRLIPLCLVPLWDADAGRGRGPSQRRPRRAGRGLQRAAHLPRPAEPVRRHVGPLPHRLRGDRDRRVHAHRFGHQDAPGLAGRARRRGGDHPLRQQCRQPGRPAVLGDAAPLPRLEAAVRRGADRLDPLRPRAGRRRVGDPSRLEQLPTATAPNHRRLTTAAATWPVASSRIRRRGHARRGRRRQCRVRDRLSPLGQHVAGFTAGGRRAVRTPRSRSPSRRSPAGTPSGCSASNFRDA